MEALLILLSRYSSSGEAFFVGAMQALLFFGVIAIVRAIKGKRKDMDEVSKDDKNNNSDW